MKDDAFGVFRGVSGVFAENAVGCDAAAVSVDIGALENVEVAGAGVENEKRGGGAEAGTDVDEEKRDAEDAGAEAGVDDD